MDGNSNGRALVSRGPYQKTIVDQEHFVEDERIVQYKTLQSGVLMKEKRVGG
jgi:hypothetical protein